MTARGVQVKIIYTIKYVFSIINFRWVKSIYNIKLKIYKLKQRAETMSTILDTMKNLHHFFVLGHNTKILNAKFLGRVVCTARVFHVSSRIRLPLCLFWSPLNLKTCFAPFFNCWEISNSFKSADSLVSHITSIFSSVVHQMYASFVFRPNATRSWTAPPLLFRS